MRLLARIVVPVAAGVLFAAAGCSSSDPPPPPAVERSVAAPASDAPAAPPPREDPRPRIVILGDSLTAGLGLNQNQAFPVRLQEMVDKAGFTYAVVNMGVSGDTSAGGLRRLDWALEGDVAVLVLALGANDGLRGLSPEDLEHNLAAMIEAARARKVDVLLCGMEAPPNFGSRYTNAFRQVYPRLAQRLHVKLVPFLLEGVAGNPALNQPDGVHPTEAGARIVANVVWRQLEPMLQHRGTP